VRLHRRDDTTRDATINDDIGPQRGSALRSMQEGSSNDDA